jgi:hypothetical protein
VRISVVVTVNKILQGSGQFFYLILLIRLDKRISRRAEAEAVRENRMELYLRT